MITPTRKHALIFYHEMEGTVYYSTDPQLCTHAIQQNHILAYVYLGELSLQDGKHEIAIPQFHSVFIRKNHRVKFSFRPDHHGNMKIVMVVLNRNTLLRFYQKMDKTSFFCNAESHFRESFLEISSNVDIESLFLSLVPYINEGKQPSANNMELKITEVVHSLLNTNKNMAAALFDFAEPWKIDIMEFLSNNFMYKLSLKEIAVYTGRSVATFKRDFKKLSDLTPQKWITKKRMEYAKQQLKEGRSVSDIYLDLGFSSLSHFSTAYKKEFGLAPTKKVRGSN